MIFIVWMKLLDPDIWTMSSYDPLRPIQYNLQMIRVEFTDENPRWSYNFDFKESTGLNSGLSAIKDRSTLPHQSLKTL